MGERVVGDTIFSNVGHGSAGEAGVGGLDEEGGGYLDDLVEELK